MNKSLLSFCMLLMMSFVQAENRDDAPTGKKNPGRDHVLLWSTPDNLSYLDAVKEHLDSKAKKPNIERFDAVKNFKRFCSGVDDKYPDVIATWRDPTLIELERCRDNGVNDLVRIKLGDEAIVFAAEKSAKPLPLSRKILWRAFSREVFEKEADSSSLVIANPHQKWKQIDKTLPDMPIRLHISEDKTALSDSFKVLGLEYGCLEYDWINVMKYHRHFRKLFRALCHRARSDGKVIVAGKNDKAVAKLVTADKKSIGVMSFSAWARESDRLQAMTVEGVAPSLETIKNGEYVLVRPHYIFVKKASMGKVPGLSKLVKELSSKAAIGKSGYLTNMALVQTGTPEKATTKVVMPVKEKKNGKQP